MDQRTFVWEAMHDADSLHRALCTLGHRLEGRQRFVSLTTTLASGGAFAALLAELKDLPWLPKVVAAIAFLVSTIGTAWSFRERSRDMLALAEKMSLFEAKWLELWLELNAGREIDRAELRSVNEDWVTFKASVGKYLVPGSPVIKQAEEAVHRARRLETPK